MVKPDYFIIGGPKCGTTALSEYLRTHPQIFVSTPKEPHFFATDIPGYQKGRTLDQYIALFDNAGYQIKRYGEASVYYMFSRESIENIFSFNRNAQLIVMLRKPTQLVYSLHSQLLYSRNEDIPSFKKAWEAQALRLQGKLIPTSCTDPKVLQYRGVGMLGEQLERLFNSSFKRRQIHIIFFEDFISNTRGVYKEVLDFLGVDDDGRGQFPVINTNTQHRLAWLGGAYINTPEWLSCFVKLCKRFTGVNQFNLSRYIARVNTSTVKRPPLSAEMKQTLREVYTDDIALLGQLTGRDLAHWLF